MWLNAGFSVRMRCRASLMTMASPLLWNTCAARRSSASALLDTVMSSRKPWTRTAAVRPVDHADQFAQPQPAAVRGEKPVLELVILAAGHAGAALLDDGVALRRVELAAPEPGGAPGLRRVAGDLLDLRADVGEALLLGIGTSTAPPGWSPPGGESAARWP